MTARKVRCAQRLTCVGGGLGDRRDVDLAETVLLKCGVQGEALLVFTRNAALLATSMPQEAVKKLIVPLLVRAADQGGDCSQMMVHSAASDAQLSSNGTTAARLQATCRHPPCCR